MLSTETIVLVCVTFFFGGYVKGLTGLGLPVIVLACLAPLLGVKVAMAVMLVPCIVTNIWQALAGGALKEILGRLWSYLVAACVGIWFGVGALSVTDGALLFTVLGVVLCIYSLLGLMHSQVPPPGHREPWLSPVAGGLAGLFFGFTGTFLVPGILYLQALGMRRDLFVQTLGVTFIVISSALTVSMSRHRLFPQDLVILSSLALTPTAIGIWFGQRQRRKVSEEQFRTIVFVAFLLSGLYMVVRGVLD